MRLRDKVALVTGAAHDRSIGWGIARALAEEGADVVVNDIAAGDMLDARVADLGRMGRSGLGIRADVSDAAAVEAMFEAALAQTGHLDIVVSNAGIIRWEPFLDITPDNLRALVAVNIQGNVNVCRAAAQHMINRGAGGRIIITSSVQTYTHFPVSPVYGGTKFAMHAFVGTLAMELAPYGITVNHIGPGWVRSPLNDVAPDQQTPEGVEGNRRSVPLKRDGRIEEMGKAAVYFASEDGAYTTGAFLRVDGGLGIGKFTR